MKKRVLVTVMTYPNLSGKYFETVCTAGFQEDGSWIRIFPIPLRLLPTDNYQLKYHKWQWIEVDLEQDPLHDDRPESFHITNIDSLKALDRFSSKPVNWPLRLEWVLKNKRIFTNMSELLECTKRNELSLAILKPTKIKNFIIVHSGVDEEYNEKLSRVKQKYEQDQTQLSLFGEGTLKKNFKFAEKIPFKFKYVFETEDGKERKLSINDWEIIVLYRNLRSKYDEKIACEKVKEKYMNFVKNCDVYLLLGTSFEWQKRSSKNPYMILSVFAPPKGTMIQPSLF